MSINTRGLRLMKSLEILKTKSYYDATVLNKINIHSIDNGTLKCTLTVDSSMCNLVKTLHGGCISSIVDVLSFFSQVSNPDGRASWTTSMNVMYLLHVYFCTNLDLLHCCLSNNVSIYGLKDITFYLASAKLGETLNVKTIPLKYGKLSVVETHISNSTGRLLAKGVTTFLAATEQYQYLLKEASGFDVYEP